MTDNDLNNDFVLMTDANCGVPQQWLDEYEIEMIDMPYAIDGVESNYDLERSEELHAFYETMREGASVTTMQRNAEDFKAFWTPFLEAGRDVLYVGFSSELSGTYQSSCMARDEMRRCFPQRKIYTADTLLISMPMGFIVRECARMRQKGAGIEAVCQWVEDNRQTIGAVFSVEDLVYLRRGGRLSGASAFIGTLLDVKPLIYINPEGKLVPFEKAKGRKKAHRRMVELVRAHAPNSRSLAIVHADCLDAAESVRDMLREYYPDTQIVISAIGPVIGSHTGPGTVGICFFANDREVMVPGNP